MSIGRFVVVALFVVATPADAQVSNVSVPGFDGRWEIDERSAKVGTHLGRPAILVRGNAPPVLAADVDFADGTIEFDLSAMPGGHFVGFVFRYADGANHENVYFRLHKSGEFEAVQYAPRVNGSGGTWQLYPQFFGAATLPVDGWVRVRADIRGSAMHLFVGGSRLAALEVGYSDDIVVWLNGTPLFEGRNSLGSRYPGFLGVTSMVERVYLPLRAGANELTVALSDRIGGWGLMARVIPPTAAEFAPSK
jgi:hypothetical protein